MNRATGCNQSICVVTVADLLTFLAVAINGGLVFAQGQDASKKPAGPALEPEFPVRLQVGSNKPDGNGKQKITVTITMEPDFYVFANQPGDEDFLPARTILKIVGQRPLKSLKITYPDGEPFAIHGPDNHIRVYRGKVVIEAEVDRANGDSESLEVSLCVQPWNERRGVCNWVPTNLKITVP
jgi:Disulphide bond corrector protein DsbC